MNKSEFNELPETADEMISIVKAALISPLGLNPVQLLVGDHDIPSGQEFTFTAEQLDEMWTLLNHAQYRIHCDSGDGSFRVVATGRLGDPLSTYMPESILPEAETILGRETE